MATKSQPQLEWRFCDEMGAGDEAWSAAHTVVADPSPADTPSPRGRRWPIAWRLALLLMVVTVVYLWGRPWSSRAETTTASRHVQPTTQITSPLLAAGHSPAPVKLSGRSEMDPIEQHCSQLPPDLVLAACHPPLVVQPTVVGAQQLDPATQPCSHQSPAATAPAEGASNALLQYWNIAY